MKDKDSYRNKAGKKAAVIILAIILAACMVFSASGCSVILKAGKAVWHKIVPQKSVQPYTLSPDETDNWFTGDDTPEPDIIEFGTETTLPTQTSEIVIDAMPYIDIHSFHGAENLRSDIPVTWQRGTSILQSEVMALDIATVLWPVGYDAMTLSSETDIDGDGIDESLFIETEGNRTLRGVFLTQGNNTVNILNLISDEFWNAIAPIMDNNGTFAVDSVVQADCLDLDGDGCKEMLVAAGDDNEILAVCVLKYTGGNNLYAEIGGIIGHRLLFVTENCTLYVPYGNSANGKYVEFGYYEGKFGVIGYNMD